MDAIKRVLKSQVGGVYSDVYVSGDLKRIYALDYFDDVKVDVEDGPNGKIVRFIVEEKPVISRIEFYGNHMLEREDLMESIGYSLYSIVNPKRIVQSIDNMKNLYREKGYYNAEITYEIKPSDKKSVAVNYNIDEGAKVYIDKIVFTGNEAYSDFRLRMVMETAQKNLLSWALGTGFLEEEKLKSDINRLTGHYYRNGYIKARIGDPDIQTTEDGLVITIPIDEGALYHVGDISFSGDLVVPEEEYREDLKLDKGDVFNVKLAHEDMEKITDLTANKGYAYAEVQPLMKEHDDIHTVDIEYHIEKKGLVYFERISIVGNDKTRDKVIRRELNVVEGGLYSSTKLKDSKTNLDRLGYFEDVQFNKTQGSDSEKMNMEVDVQEQPTGAFSVGAGYSSYNSVFGMVAISQDNLFGTGKAVKLEATVGGRTANYQLSYTDPWFMDIRLNAGFDIYHQTVEYDWYDTKATGFTLRAGYPVYDWVYFSSAYSYSDVDISNVSPWIATSPYLPTDATTSKLAFKLARDTRNRYYNPTDGSENWVNYEHAGTFLGGNAAFDRVVLNSSWYFPLPWDETAFHVRGQAGWMWAGECEERHDAAGNIIPCIPTYERFYLGGLNSVRGFQWSDISPRDPANPWYKIGGEQMAFFNFEFIFPLFKEAGVGGVIFYDTGNVWTKDQNMDFSDMKQSYGGGIRYKSPFGPMRIEYGRVINPGRYDPEGNWEFSVGGTF